MPLYLLACDARVGTWYYSQLLTIQQAQAHITTKIYKWRMNVYIEERLRKQYRQQIRGSSHLARC